MATNLTTAGSAEDKLRWAFRMYDKDGSGQLLAFAYHCRCCCLSRCFCVLGFLNLQKNGCGITAEDDDNDCCDLSF